jgi:hypothetical protein
MECTTVFRVLLAGTLLATAGCKSLTDVVRARAANELACDESDISVEFVAGSTYRATGCDRTNEYTCDLRRLTCFSDNANPRPTQSVPVPTTPAPAAASLRAPPSAAGGFRFLATSDEIRGACEQSGHAYASSAAASGACDGVAAEVGAPARADFRYCGPSLCAVVLSVQVGPNEPLAVALMRWKGALTERYGAPSSTRSELPNACTADVTPCLADGTARIAFDWKWPTRESISLSIQLDEQKKARVSIAYGVSQTIGAAAPGI